MKYKNPKHPKLYLEIKKIEDNFILIFKDNIINQDGFRKIRQEVVKQNNINLKDFLYKKNLSEYVALKKYIIIQKRVLQKHENRRNYDAIRIVNESIKMMLEFKLEFENWFLGKNYGF